MDQVYNGQDRQDLEGFGEGFDPAGGENCITVSRSWAAPSLLSPPFAALRVCPVSRSGSPAGALDDRDLFVRQPIQLVHQGVDLAVCCLDLALV